MNCIPRFAIYPVLLQSASKIIRNNFRCYFKIGVQRINWIYFTFTTIHCMTSIAISTRWSKLQKQKGSLSFATWGYFFVHATLCCISIVVKVAGFWISRTFFARIACSPKFCRFVTINNGGKDLSRFKIFYFLPKDVRYAYIYIHSYMFPCFLSINVYFKIAAKTHQTMQQSKNIWKPSENYDLTLPILRKL